MIIYLVTHDYTVGRRFAAEQGWTAVAFNRFAAATEEYGKLDIRIVRLPIDLVPPPGGLHIAKAPDFQANPFADTITNMVEAGRARWIDL